MAEKRRTRALAAVRPEPTAEPVHLDKAGRRVFSEALRLGSDLAVEVESNVSSYGRWLLERVFDDDAAAALDAKSKNPVWLELVRRAGGPTLPLSRRMLYVSLQLAARDRRITDQSWRRLDAGRKEILLPLDDDARLREAAQHVSKFNLSQTKTRQYVTSALSDAGVDRQVRVSAPALTSRMRKLRESLAGPAVLRRVRDLSKALEPADRATITAEIEKLRDALVELSRAVKLR